MHFFITGHTGFKGAWLTLLLRQLGHSVSGLALDPVKGGLFSLANLQTEMESHVIADIREFEAVKEAIQQAKPDFAIHMAAQPLVIRSYADPIETYTTNVDGTLNFLRAITLQKSSPISLIVTTDKVYRDSGKLSYSEADPLGGHDPYSASKAMADILAQSWAAVNEHLKIHIARAGNVIGAFDASDNRLMPDAIRSIRNGDTLHVRQPDSVRPWQHVLDCLGGYILLLQKVRLGKQLPTAINFGPNSENIRRVSDVLDVVSATRPEFSFEMGSRNPLHRETKLLTLDSQLATSELSWKNQIDFHKAIRWSLEELSGHSAREIAERQINEYLVVGDLG